MGATVSGGDGTGVGTGVGDGEGVGVGDGVGVGVGLGLGVGIGDGVGEAVGVGSPGGGWPPGPPLRGRTATRAMADARTRMARVIWKPEPGWAALSIGLVVEFNMVDRWSIAAACDHIGPPSRPPMRHSAMPVRRIAESDVRLLHDDREDHQVGGRVAD